MGCRTGPDGCARNTDIVDKEQEEHVMNEEEESTAEGILQESDRDPVERGEELVEDEA